jgi:hypothetical protein
VDLDVLREKNKELTTRVQELDLQLFQTLVQPLQRKLTIQSTQRQRRIQRFEKAEKRLETDDELLFEDAREDGSQITATDSEDKHSHHTDPELEFETLRQEDLSSRSPIKDEEEERTRLLSLYEQQFEKMKVLPLPLPLSLDLFAL